MKNQPKQDDDWPVDLPPRSIDWDMVKHWLGIAVGWLFAFAVIGGLVWYFVREHSAAVRQKHADEMRQQQTASNIAALVAKYNTVTNWESSLPDRGIAAPPFSIDVSTALIPSNGQPVLLSLDLGDVAKKDSRYTAQFSQRYSGFQLSLELQCTGEQVKRLLATGKSSFAAVARISEISRPRFKFVGSVSGSGEDAESSIELENSPCIFCVKGELLDAIQLP